MRAIMYVSVKVYYDPSLVIGATETVTPEQVIGEECHYEFNHPAILDTELVECVSSSGG